MVLAAVIALYVLVAANFAYSLRLAYSIARSAKGGGYPILGHVAHNFILLLFAAIFLPKVGDVPLVIRVVAGIALLVVPALNVWLIVRLDRLGERRRAVARGG
jgi:hypothetical protein